MASLSPWTVTASRHIHRDRWITVRADDCLTPAGVEVAPYYVLEAPDWVQVVAIDGNRRVVLVRQYRHALGAVSLEVPAGAMDSGDADPLAAAARELREETGYVADEFVLLASLSPNPATHANRVHVVLARGARFVGVVGQDPSEEIEVVPVSCAEALRVAISGEMVHALHTSSLVMGLHAAGLLHLEVSA